MLTIHTPIELTADPSMLKLNHNFEERLTGNYRIIGSGFEPEDMLHFLSEPPEVYLEEGGMTALIENQKIVENRNLKLDVINNVINRILVSDTYRMTYQDQVFIESVLNKMGITDVREFIRQVQNSKEETQNVQYLTDLYWSQQESISQLLEYRKLRAKQGEKKSKEAAEDRAEDGLWLHQSILNRLQTAVVYQEVKNYISAASNRHQSITRTEMQISEQNITVQNLLLNKLRNYTHMEEQPLVYHYLNTYELGDEWTIKEDNSRIVNRMVEAVLLNALHQMYALRVNELHKQKNLWYQLAGSIYQATENTYKRFLTFHEQSFLSPHEADTYIRQVHQYQKNEIKAIRQLYEETQHSTIERENGNIPPREGLVHLDSFQAEEEFSESHPREASDVVTKTVEETKLHGQQIRSITREESLLREQLEQINQKNIRNLELLSRLRLQGKEEQGQRRINQARAREDALLALTNPEEVLLTYLESETVTNRQETVEKERLKQVFGEETIRILETLEKYQKSPRYAANPDLQAQGEAMLQRDILFREQAFATELEHHVSEKEQETVHRMEELQLFREHYPKQVQEIHRSTGERIDRIELIHKLEENTLDEEFLEEIRGIQRVKKVENEQTTQTVIEQNHTQEVINTQIHDFQTRQNEELLRMVTDKVQNQLGSISEQIYGKLEKRMDMERRRRGL